MNKLAKWAGLFAAVCMMTMTFSLAACGGDKPDSSGSDDNSVSASDTTDSGTTGSGTSDTTDSSSSDTNSSAESSVAIYTVDFESNGGSEVESQQVKEGEKVKRPDDPEKAEYYFSDWYEDKSLENVWNFAEDTVSSDITLYAKWEAVPADSVVVKFYWNFEGAPDNGCITQVVEKGSRITLPEDIEREGFTFKGWFTEDGAEVDRLTKAETNMNVYAKWEGMFTFEAEDTQLTGLTGDYDLGLANDEGAKLGYNYSGHANGANLIKSIDGASGGKYVSGLFYRGAYLQFEIDSSASVEDATLRLVLSVEYWDIKLTTSTYKITVNGTEIDFDDISLGNGQASSTEPGPRGDWKDIYINNIDLKEGENIIRLTVNNNQKLTGSGTVNAASPAVDCIKIYSASELTMTEYENK